MIADTLEISEKLNEKVDTSVKYKKVRIIPLKDRNYSSDSSLVSKNDPSNRIAGFFQGDRRHQGGSEDMQKDTQGLQRDRQAECRRLQDQQFQSLSTSDMFNFRSS